jgi:hypothetical protein
MLALDSALSEALRDRKDLVDFCLGEFEICGWKNFNCLTRAASLGYYPADSITA